ncbi:AAA domain-containing protein [Geopyxis carbonaria]|nr:AAA domain-containing protein [Geopyxis carbonaria]
MRRTKPNIIITGTPGTGKTSHSTLLAAALPEHTHLSINDIVKTDALHSGWDDELSSWIVDEDRLLDTIEERVERGGAIIDWHVCEVFPKRWIDLVVVLRADSDVLYDRLKARGYAQRKLDENMDAEIMEEILNEAKEAYDEEAVVELKSNEEDEVETNVERVVEWVKRWVEEHPDGVEG